MPKTLSIQEIAKATGLAKSTLIRYEDEGRIPQAKRDGRKWRWYTTHDRDEIVKELTRLDLIKERS